MEFSNNWADNHLIDDYLLYFEKGLQNDGMVVCNYRENMMKLFMFWRIMKNG